MDLLENYSYFSFLVIIGTSIYLMARLGPLARRIGLVDKPNERKQHELSVPAIGGVAIFISVSLGLMFVPFGLGEYRYLLFSCGLLMIVGVLDDYRDISANSKFVVQFIVAGILVFGSGIEVTAIGDVFSWSDGNQQGLNWLAAPLSVVAIVGVINAFNMIDGHDGLAASMFLVTAGTLIFLSIFGESWKIQYLLAMFCLSVGIFLLFNLPWIIGKSRQIFLGDAGSMLLGLILVYSLIVLSEVEIPTIKRTAAPWILGLPLLDMCAVVLLRVVSRVSVINADRRHIHHLLADMGYSNKKLLFLLIGLQFIFCMVGAVGTIWNFPDSVLFWLLFPVFFFYMYYRLTSLQR